MFDFDKVIRKVPDFPKPGILFYDITSLVADAKAMDAVRQEMKHWTAGKNVTKIVAVESRGFLFAPLLAQDLRVPVVLARKKGKLPGKVFSQTYELEYGTDTIEMQQCDLEGEGTVVVIDDLIATGGTLKAVADLIEKNSSYNIGGFFSVIGLPFLPYEKVLDGYEIKTLVNYNSE